MKRWRWCVLFGTIAMVGCSADNEGDGEKCVTRSLAELCSKGHCPQKPDDVAPVCDSEVGPSIRRATRCGGTFVSVSPGLSSTGYFFDADDRLVGIRSLSDLGDTCEPEGGGIASAVYGETCAAEGPETDLCEISPEQTCANQGLYSWCMEHDCPEELAAASECTGFEKQLQDNDCGGTNVSTPGAFAGAVLSYDAQGELVGVRLYSDVAELCDGTSFEETYGAPCRATGEPSQICTAPAR